MAARFDLLVIGGSAGSLSVVMKIIPLLKPSLNLATVIVFHRKQSDDSALIEVLAGRTDCRVKEADDKDDLLPAHIYVAPADYHVLIEKNKTITLDFSEKINYSRPSIDLSFDSAAEVYGPRLACLLLSGANADGVDGLLSAKRQGAFIMVQNPSTAEVPYMPQQAVEKVSCDLLIDPDNLKEFLAAILE
ncbi:chemotaxis protein CheB [Pseudochryseolinea flava]|uniref:protein-glutamate methylesterase n=1 Tax=Pseudochryseolinea flava TaxID=2059302 RepID=A0A364XZR0_9BACT|nr:chemotaxis protein CheB [Pseudochryseolinea flava]RAW00022.1 chemotaxis protein CheB [Pseudochryseolinea flava]